jgi:S-adenosylmethionine synthetase
MKSDFVFTSESVTEGHPDKLCDQVSDAIVDRFLALDPGARIVSECAVAKGIAFIATRFASEIKVDIPTLARQVIHQAGYTEGEFSARNCSILTSLIEMPASARIKQDESTLDEASLETLVARNQVTAFGFACRQTPALMPLPIWLAHRLARRLSQVRSSRSLPYLTPDGTVQVGVEYRNRHPYGVHSITLEVSQQALDHPKPEALRAELIEQVIQPVFREEPIRPDGHTQIFVNPNGVRVGGGPATHSGMTGRKTAIDTYGGYARHSQSALSGKDPLRVDRTAGYMARFAAKNLVAAGLAEECEVQLSYSIGLARPVSIQVETFATGHLDDAELARRIEANFDFRVGGIIRFFHLRQLPDNSVFYKKLAAYGQVGRMDLELPWEKTDSADCLR